MNPIQRFAEERPREYGALMVLLGGALLAFLRMYVATMGRTSLTLVLLTPFVTVYGVQALVLGTPPSALKKDRVTMTVLLLISGGGSFLLWRWLQTIPH